MLLPRLTLLQLQRVRLFVRIISILLDCWVFGCSFGSHCLTEQTCALGVRLGRKQWILGLASVQTTANLARSAPNHGTVSRCRILFHCLITLDMLAHSVVSGWIFCFKILGILDRLAWNAMSINSIWTCIVWICVANLDRLRLSDQICLDICWLFEAATYARANSWPNVPSCHPTL